ncbi:MAG: hypothetical protein D6674_02175 [Acidobacteria bacterium]|jgi:hypothetical protein|nr:MAG: hypothetical protein D6674_02175 [Acidobacteriota bacterium]
MKKGFTIVELLTAVAISLLIVIATVGVYVVANRVFAINRELSFVKESTKEGIYGLEWFFERWGVGVACFNQVDPNACGRPQFDSNRPINVPYPPASALYMLRNEGEPCDEVVFFGSIGGMAFVDRLQGINQVAVMSCRLNQTVQQNCYHVWRGARVFRDANNPTIPLIFSVGGLSQDNLDCSRETNRNNATMNLILRAQNGQLETFQGNTRILTDQLTLEGGDMLVRVPHRIRFFCQNNPQDNNNLWLYVETTDMANNCNWNEPPIPIVRVNSFQIEQVPNAGVLVNMQVNQEGRAITIQRFFGR